MADNYQQLDVELDDETNVEEAHDPKNAEAQSIASVKDAETKGPTAKARKGDKKNSEPMPKTKAGMINAAYTAMSSMKKEDLEVMLNKFMGEDLDDEAADIVAEKLAINVDFSDDLNALVESEATLSEEFKAKTAIIFEAAVKSKLSEEVDRLEEAYATELHEEIATTKAELVEKVDSYLNYVVENWMEENKLAVQNGLRTEIAENFMTSLKALFVESYVDVPEGKVDLVDELVEQVEELEAQLNSTTAKAIAVSEELEVYKRTAIIREASRDLAETQVEKLKKLVEDVDFDDADVFAAKVKTIKESYFNKKSAEVLSEEAHIDEAETTVEVSNLMARYVSAIQQSSNK